MAINKNKLIQAAAKAREGSVSSYFKFKVGAVLLTKIGEIIGGANAERVALFDALTGGKLDCVAVAVVAALRRRADAVRCVPAVVARICAGRESICLGQR